MPQELSTTMSIMSNSMAHVYHNPHKGMSDYSINAQLCKHTEIWKGGVTL